MTDYTITTQPDFFNKSQSALPQSGGDISALFAASAKAKAEFPDIPRTRTATVRMKNGGSYSYTYADLADVFRAINPVLAAYGLTVMQFPNGDVLETTIGHESGAWISRSWPIKGMPQRGLDDAQAYQSAVQVAKRYALTALLGITTEETVEGNGPRLGRDTAEKINDRFETGDGTRLPRGARIEKGWEPRRIAEEVARAIREQFTEPKTQVGLHGVWDRNAMFIEKLRDKHPDLFSEVFDEFQKFTDEAPETPGEARSEAAKGNAE